MTLRHLLGNNVMIDIIGKGKRFMQRIQRKLIHMLANDACEEALLYLIAIIRV